MDADEVGLPVDAIHILGTLQPQLTETLGRHIGVVGHDLHLEATSALGHQEPDAAEPDDAQRLAHELNAAVLAAVPAALFEGLVSLGDVARAGHDHGDRVLGCAEHVAGRGVDDDDAALGGGLHVHVVYTHAGAAHDAEPRARFDDLGRDFGGRAHHQRVVVFDARHELLRSPIDAEVYVEVLLEKLDAFCSELLLDQHPLAIGHLRASANFSGLRLASMKTFWAAATPAPNGVS